MKFENKLFFVIRFECYLFSFGRQNSVRLEEKRNSINDKLSKKERKERRREKRERKERRRKERGESTSGEKRHKRKDLPPLPPPATDQLPLDAADQASRCSRSPAAEEPSVSDSVKRLSIGGEEEEAEEDKQISFTPVDDFWGDQPDEGDSPPEVRLQTDTEENCFVEPSEVEVVEPEEDILIVAPPPQYTDDITEMADNSEIAPEEQQQPDAAPPSSAAPSVPEDVEAEVEREPPILFKEELDVSRLGGHDSVSFELPPNFGPRTPTHEFSYPPSRSSSDSSLASSISLDNMSPFSPPFSPISMSSSNSNSPSNSSSSVVSGGSNNNTGEFIVCEETDIKSNSEQTSRKFDVNSNFDNNFNLNDSQWQAVDKPVLRKDLAKNIEEFLKRTSPEEQKKRYSYPSSSDNETDNTSPRFKSSSPIHPTNNSTKLDQKNRIIRSDDAKTNNKNNQTNKHSNDACKPPGSGSSTQTNVNSNVCTENLADQKQQNEIPPSWDGVACPKVTPLVGGSLVRPIARPLRPPGAPPIMARPVYPGRGLVLRPVPPNYDRPVGPPEGYFVPIRPNNYPTGQDCNQPVPRFPRTAVPPQVTAYRGTNPRYEAPVAYHPVHGPRPDMVRIPINYEPRIRPPGRGVPPHDIRLARPPGPVAPPQYRPPTAIPLDPRLVDGGGVFKENPRTAGKIETLQDIKNNQQSGTEKIVLETPNRGVPNSLIEKPVKKIETSKNAPKKPPRSGRSSNSSVGKADELPPAVFDPNSGICSESSKPKEIVTKFYIHPPEYYGRQSQDSLASFQDNDNALSTDYETAESRDSSGSPSRNSSASSLCRSETASSTMSFGSSYYMLYVVDPIERPKTPEEHLSSPETSPTPDNAEEACAVLKSESTSSVSSFRTITPEPDYFDSNDKAFRELRGVSHTSSRESDGSQSQNSFSTLKGSYSSSSSQEVPLIKLSLMPSFCALHSQTSRCSSQPSSPIMKDPPPLSRACSLESLSSFLRRIPRAPSTFASFSTLDLIAPSHSNSASSVTPPQPNSPDRPPSTDSPILFSRPEGSLRGSQDSLVLYRPVPRYETSSPEPLPTVLCYLGPARPHETPFIFPEVVIEVSFVFSNLKLLCFSYLHPHHHYHGKALQKTPCLDE